MKELLSGTLFFLLVLFAGFVAFTLLSLSQGVQDLSFEIVLSINCMFNQILFNYIFSSYGHRLSLCSSGVANDAYFSQWHQLPVIQQNLILIIVRRAQQTFYLDGYRFFNCSMDTFQKVNAHFQQITNIFEIFFACKIVVVTVVLQKKN